MSFGKQFLGNLKKRRVVPFHFDRILGAYLAYMEVLSMFSKCVRYSLYAIDIISKHTCAACSTNKTGFSKILSVKLNMN